MVRCGLARAGSEQGGVVVLVGSPAHVTVPPVEALVRWDPSWFAAKELDERSGLGLPPASALATLTGARRDLMAAVEGVAWPAGSRVLGPLPVGAAGADRLLVTTSRSQGEALADVLRGVRAMVAARREGEPIQIRMDAPDPTV